MPPSQNETNVAVALIYQVESLCCGCFSDDDRRGVLCDPAGVFASDETVVPSLAPPYSPRVLDGPVLHSVLLAVAHNQHGVVDLYRVAVLFGIQNGNRRERGGE